jgi:NitT/TauT family transport system substrate-binding protein
MTMKIQLLGSSIIRTSINLVVVSAIFAACSAIQPATSAATPFSMTIGSVPSPTALLVVVADKNGYFTGQGLDVQVIEYSRGLVAVDDMLDGKLDAALSTSLSLVTKSFMRDDFKIIASMARLGNDNQVIARPDAGIHSIRDLKGKRVGVTKGSSPQFTLHLFLAQEGMSEKDLVLVYNDAEKLMEMLKTGEIDAACLLRAKVEQARQELGENAVVINDAALIKINGFVSVRADYARQHPEAIERLLRACIQAEDYVLAHQDEAIALLADQFKLDKKQIVDSLENSSFHLNLDQALLIDLEAKANWMIEEQFTDQKEMPNFLNYFYLDGLEKVDPQRVSIIH